MAKKISIAIDTTYMDRRGAKGTAVFIREFVVQMIRYKEQFDITLIHCEKIPEDSLYAEFNEIVIRQLPFPKGRRLLSELVFFLTTRKRFDIYYFAYSKLPPHFFLAPARKIISMQYDGGPQTAGVELLSTKGKIRAWMIPFMRRFIDVFIVSSHFGKGGLVNFWKLPENKIEVVYGGAADKLFKPMQRKEARAYVSKTYSIDRSFILASGRLDPHKNILRLIEAYDILKNKFNVTHQLIITGGAHMSEYTEAVMNSITEKNLESDVLILRVREFEEMPIFYSGAEVMIFPSLYEGFGLPLVEAMQCGVPTVTARSSSLVEVGGEATEFFDPTDSKDMARGIMLVLSDVEYQEKLITLGLKRAQDFSWEKNADQMVTICKRLLTV